MKRSISGKACSLAIIFAVVSFCVEAADYYVVIGSFKEEANAARLARSVRDDFQQASYSFNDDRDVYFVHVMKTDRKEEAQNWSLYLKREKGFKDAWVFQGDAVEIPSSPVAEEAPTQRSPRFTTSASETHTTDDLVLASANREDNIASYGSSNIAAAWTYKDGFSFLRNPGNFRHITSGTDLETARHFRFIVEDPEGNQMPAEVLLVNFERAKRIATFRSGEEVAIRGTRPGQMITFICEELGYGMETRMFNIDHLSRGRDIVKDKAGVWEVHIKLKEMEVYDQAILYKTSFHRDATVLEPTSRQELDELTDMMKSNPGYKIVIHSHCNAGPRRSIALTSDDYFGEHIASVRKGTDKFLTRQRARVIRDYLVDHGIEKKRIDVVGWGSMEMLVKPDAKDVSLNERIEVELVSNQTSL